MRRTEALAAELAARWVPLHSQPLCKAFAPQPAPAEFWCATCGWNETLHEGEWMRAAVAAELAKLGGTA